jgi:hypothetical protein
MDIKTFVSEALTQIIHGVEDAQSKTKYSAINPSFGKASPDVEKENLIEFDIAVALERGNESKSGLAVIAGVVSIGANGKSNKSESIVNRIKFSVPVAFSMSKKWPVSR